MTTALNITAAMPHAYLCTMDGRSWVEPLTDDDRRLVSQTLPALMRYSVEHGERDEYAAFLAPMYGSDAVYFILVDAGVDPGIAHCIRCHELDRLHADALDAYAADMAERQARRERAEQAERDRLALEADRKRRGMRTCPPCGGAGGSSHWPGFTCYECGGRCEVPARR